MPQKVMIRSMIVAPKDHVLIFWDFKQIESWMVAFLADEPNMKHSLMHSDIHVDTAQVLFPRLTEISKEARYIGKRYNHASAYRMGYKRAAEVINKDADKPPYITVTLKESRAYSEAWHEHYNLLPWWGSIEAQLDLNRILVTPYGRERMFFEAWGDELFKEATAHVPQSTAADHMNGALQPELGIKGGLIEVDRQFVLTGACKIINQSHDSIGVETHKNNVDDIKMPITNLLRRPLVINGEQFTVPVSCELGERWGELEEVEV